jgi:hypothetical protein
VKTFILFIDQQKILFFEVFCSLVFMAEENQGHGTNPPQEQPDEPLPSKF